jgi:translation initiation factor 4A
MTEEYDNNKVITGWEDCVKNEDLLRGIYAYGFENPSPIQAKAIYPMTCKRDVIAQAQSGTGKTGAFTIGSLSLIDPALNKTQAILMAPTHELASQTTVVCNSISSHMNICVKKFVGGTPVMEDRRSIDEQTPHVVVGCPGRIFDLIRRGFIDARNVRIFVVDEADEMLSKGFKDQIQSIFQWLPNDVQVGIFSATLTREVMELTPKFMRDPVEITMTADKLTLEGIRQYYIACDYDDDKFDALKKLFRLISINQCIIYCNSVNRVSQLCQAMHSEGFAVDCIHRNMSKVEREDAFRNFRSGRTRFLVSSNITARGIDVQQVSVVINFDITPDPHTYLHRIGRSGRWGRKGTAINFITQRDTRIMRDIENYYSIRIEPLPEGEPMVPL